jgi:hypothetical protein
VSVDLPHGDGSFKDTEPNLRQCIKVLNERGYDAHLFLTDSTEPTTVEAVRRLAPFDLCFIDGYHTEEFIRADWTNYGPLAKMVAFHDISWRADGRTTKKAQIAAPKVWDEVKQGHRHQEFKCQPRDYGIGVLWR